MERIARISDYGNFKAFVKQKRFDEQTSTFIHDSQPINIADCNDD